MEPHGDGGSAARYVVRYAVRPNGVYKLDHRSGKWSSIEGQEAPLLFLLITIYYERIHYQLVSHTEEPGGPESGLQPEQARLDDEVTPADGYRHVVIDPLALKSCRDHGWSVWALCGRRFVPAAAETTQAACPKCESANHTAERLRDIEDDLRRRFFARQLDYKDPVTAIRLFLVRASCGANSTGPMRRQTTWTWPISSCRSRQTRRISTS